MEEFEDKSIDAKLNLDELLGANEQAQSLNKIFNESLERFFRHPPYSDQDIERYSVAFQLRGTPQLEEIQKNIEKMFESIDRVPIDKLTISDDLLHKLTTSDDRLQELKKNNDFNSSVIYLESLRSLLKNEEFCKSQKWVSYLKEQIKLMGYLLEDSFYDPHKADDIKNKYISEDVLKAERKDISKRASDERHAENRASKEAAISYYKSHRDDFKNKDEASLFIGSKIVGYPFSTVRQWLKGK
jgi:hypothetical protein